jgi:hypothetical protein
VITVLRDRYARSWPQLDPQKPLRHTDRAYALDLGKALERVYKTDAHFVAYGSPNGHRLNVESIDRGVVVELTCIVFDIDCAATHGTKEPAPESWRRELRERVQALAAEHLSPYYYETRGGARIVYRQAEPTTLRTQADAREWSRVYAVALAYLSRCFGLECDAACHDWQRLFRLPRATRDRDAKPENWPSFGDPHAIGHLLISPTAADVRTAERSSRAFRATEFTPSTGTGEGLLYYLLRARGDVSERRCSRAGWVVRCPNRAKHSNNTDGTDSTVLYPPLAGKQLGAIECKHAHCQRITVPNWLRFFSDRELAAARIAAGITTKAA